MNQKKIIRIVLLLLIASFISAPVYASDDCVIEFFYEIGCKDCKEARPVIGDVASKHNLPVVEYEITDRSSLEKMEEYGIGVVPAVVISGQVVLHSDYDGNLSSLADLIDQSIGNAQTGQNQTDQTNQTDQINQTDLTDHINQTQTQKPPIKLSATAVFVAGLVAGFNPCLLAILAFIATVTLSSEGGSRSGRRRMLWLVVVFCAGIFITYLIAGFGLLRMIGHTEGTRELIESILVAIIVLLGIWHIYDAYHVKKYNTSSFKTSGSTMSFIENLVRKESLPAIFLLGVLFSLVKAPCVGALYLSILNMLLKNAAMSGALYLVV